MRSKWYSNRKELREDRFIEVVKKCDCKKLGAKSVDVSMELKGDFIIVLGISLN